MNPAADKVEGDLLLLCSQTSCETVRLEHIQALTQSKPDWNLFLDLVIQNEVSAVVHESLERAGWKDVPPWVREQLYLRTVASIAQHHRLSEELVTVLDALAAAGIDAMAMKGPAAGACLYAKPWMRLSGDLDILTEKDQAGRARAILLQHGYQEVKGDVTDDPAWERKHFVLLNAVKNVVVELHWSFHEPSFAFALTTQEVFRSAIRIPLNGKFVSCACPEHLLMLLAVHGCRHGWDSLKWVCDIAQLVRSQSEGAVDRALDLSKRVGCRRMVELALRLATDLLSVPEGAGVSAAATDSSLDKLVGKVRRKITGRRRQESEGDQQAAAANAENFLFLLLCREQCSTRLKLLYFRVASSLQPNARDREFLSVPGFCSALYWAVRPLRLLQTYGLRSLLNSCRLLVRNCWN